MNQAENIEVLPADLHAGLRYGRHRALFAYWEEIRGEHAMPSRVDFDPVDIPKLLPYVALVDIVQPGPKFRYRVVGTAMSVTERMGYSMGYEKIVSHLMLPLGRDWKTPDMILCSAISDSTDYPELETALTDPRSVSAMEVISLKVA